MFNYDNLMNYFQTNFNMMHYHKYSISDLENMVPWERIVYIDLLKKVIKEENEKLRDEMNMRRVRR